MNPAGTFDIDEGIGIITIDSPPVNSLGVATRRALDQGFRALAANDDVKAIVLTCAGRTFFAGADISELGKPPQEPLIRDVFDLIESMEKPVIAAIHGTALGGGFELALICHYRIAVPTAQLGLPEVNLGIIPGLGGTQRLPRVVGPEIALDVITKGSPVAAPRAFELGMIDALASPDDLRGDAIAFARGIVAEGKPLRRVRDRHDMIEPARGNRDLFADFRKRNARAFRGFKAPEAAIKAIEAAVEKPFAEGMAFERELLDMLLASTESAAQRYYFFAERETIRVPDIDKSAPTLAIASVGVIGAGTMGGGISMNFLDIGVPVTLVETSQEALDRGIGVIRRNYEAAAARGRLTVEQVEQRMALIKPAVGLASLAGVDLVIEAVFEEMGVKKDIFAELDRIARKGAILASNTSFLDLDEIAAATSRPEWVVGLHFFSPANVMRLLEVVRGARTAPEVIATAMGLAKKINKVPVLSKVCRGFIANRVMSQRSLHAEALVLAGPTPQEIDQALFDYGFAMGPFQMIDLVGLDVIGRGSAERTLRGEFVERGRFGQKKGGGFYDYDENRKPTPSTAAAEAIAAFALHKGVDNKGPLPADEIVARLLYPVVNEAAKVLEEGIAMRASDIDVAAILGYGWPVYRGGPMFWADTVGLAKIVDSLKRQGIEPAKLLIDKAGSAGRFTRT